MSRPGAFFTGIDMSGSHAVGYGCVVVFTGLPPGRPSPCDKPPAGARWPADADLPGAAASTAGPALLRTLRPAHRPIAPEGSFRVAMCGLRALTLAVARLERAHLAV